MLYLTHAHEATACSQTLLLPAFLPAGPCLAVVKHSSISFLSLAVTERAQASSSTDLLEEIQTVDIHGRIISVQAVTSTSAGAQSQMLLVLTDHYRPRLIALTASSLSASDQEARISTKAVLVLSEAARSPAESALGLWLEPFSDIDLEGRLGQRVAVCHAYKGSMRIVPLTPSVSEMTPKGTSSVDQDVTMDDDATLSLPSSVRSIDFAQSFSARLPHPTLISCALLPPKMAGSTPIMALLSLSSLPSRIPGLGEQCLPVLSFHSVDLATKELPPLPWGPPRNPPHERASNPPADPESASSRSRNGDKSQTRKQHGPSAIGLNLDSAALQRREEAWAASELAQAHVPLPTTDAVGAHLIHAIPASLGGGIVLFCENSILYIPPPQVNTAEPLQHASPSVSKGKRRKASTSSSIDSRRLSSASKAVDDGQTLPASSSSTMLENKKRRRSSAATVASVTSPASPSASRSVPASKLRLKLLRASLPYPMQVVAAVNIVDSQNQPVLTHNASSARPILTVLFGTSSGHLNALRLSLSDDVVSEHCSSGKRPGSLRIERLGEISQPAGPHSLTYLGDELVQVSSFTGDNALYKIESRANNQDLEELLDEQIMTPPSSPTQTRSFRASAIPTRTMDPTELPLGGSLIELRKWDNLGPIVDFVVDDGAGDDPSRTSAAQARIVTCSGSGPSGSIRVVRNGVSVQELTTIQVPDVSRIWTINNVSPALTTIAVILSFPTATSYLVFGEHGKLVDASSALDSIGLKASTSTLVATSIHKADNNSLVQVQANGASLARQEGTSLILLDQWRPEAEAEITSASANAEGQLVVALSNYSLVYLTIDGGRFHVQTSIPLDEQISCLDISSTNLGQRADYLACGFWATRSMQIYSLPDLIPVAQRSAIQTPFASVPRSILLHQFGAVTNTVRDAFQPRVLIGLGDGTLVSYSLSLPTAESYSRTVGISDCKIVSLGSKALYLSAIETCEGLRAVAVAGTRSCIVYADAKRISYNTIKYSDLNCVATLHAGLGQQTHLFALKDHLKMCSIGALQRRDIRTIPLGLEQPLAIAAWQSQRAFAISTWTFLPRGSATNQTQARGSIQILDQANFQLLDQVRLDPNERPNCVKVITLDGKYVRGQREVLVVGTGYMLPDATETMSGRLLGYEMPSVSTHSKKEPKRALRNLFTREVRGNVYSIVGLQGRLVAAVNSEVMLFSGYERNPADGEHSSNPQDRGMFKLKQKGSWASSFIACNLSVVQPNHIIVGDALRSMNILRIIGEEGHVVEIARDCDPFWTTATEVVDEATQTFIGADVSFNLYTTQRVQLSEQVKKRIKQAKDADLESGRRPMSTSNASTSANDDGYAHVMKRQAVWHYGDMINKFLRTSLASDTGTAHVGAHKLLFCTASGAIGVLAQVDDAVAQTLRAVERRTIQLIEWVDAQEQAQSAAQPASNLPRSTGVVGGINYEDWRTLRTDHRTQAPAGFLDGQIINMVVNGRLDRHQIAQVLSGPDEHIDIGADHETVQRYIEALAQIS